jgi:hypothetical protein
MGGGPPDPPSVPPDKPIASEAQGEPVTVQAPSFRLGFSLGEVSVDIPKPEITGASDEKAQKEFESFRQKQLHEQAMKGGQLDLSLRGAFTWIIFGLVLIWLFFVGGVIVAAGFKWNAFTISDAVLLGLLGTTTANIVGLFLVVTNYLFPKK